MKLPYKINPKLEALTLLVLLGASVAAFYFYTNFPPEVATHWNFQGEADGFSGRAFAAFFFPALAWAIYLLITFLPLIDPKRDRYKEFSGAYNAMRLLVVVVLTVLYATASANGIGYNIPVGTVTPILVGIMFVALGTLMPRIKRNWFFGIRTPWTLSSETVWAETHRVGAVLFALAGAAFIIIPFLPNTFALPLFIAVLVLLLVNTVGYSWWVWRKLQ
ncbi:MAG: SdpI family protein [Parcubacteria group bacterium]|nr:SdpI family protein [Parcubacteria group bacterium]